MKRVPKRTTVDMSTKLGRLDFSSPVFTASGCAAAGKELDQFIDITTIGAVVTKSVMLNPRSGRATPRMAETPSGMLNGIGLQGPGIDDFIQNDLSWLSQKGAKTIVSIAGNNVEEFGKVADKLRDIPGVVAIEVNISCPNVENRGQVFACDPYAAADVINNVRRNVSASIPLFAKLSPDVTDITEIAKSVVKAGADGLSVINTLLGMVIDTDTLLPKLSGKTGGLSGPAIRPVAVRCVYQIRKALPNIPIIGMGGIRNGRDAIEFFAAGANAISVGTTVFNDPEACVRIHDETAEILQEKGIRSLSEIISAAHREDL
jgi:dihydroorotate dehydrogenase (NAD+) catalytic subunit